MKITTMNEFAIHEISLIFLKSILLNYESRDFPRKLKEIEDFSKRQNIANPIYAIGNLYKAIYILIKQQIYSSVVIPNSTNVFDYLGIKWSPEKSMIFVACGDYMTFYNKHYKWQRLLRKNAKLNSLLEENIKKKDQHLSNIASSYATYIERLLSEKQDTFYQEENFLMFCNELIKTQSPILLEPQISKIILDLLQKRKEIYKDASKETQLIKQLKK